MRATVVIAEDGTGGCEVHVFPAYPASLGTGAHSYMLSLPALKFGKIGTGGGGEKQDDEVWTGDEAIGS